MSFSSDYRDRQRRSRRREQRLVIYAIRSIVTTAALVAIAFAFDVPEKIREKLRKPAPETVVAHNEPTAEARKQPPVEESPNALANSRRQRTFTRQNVAVEHKPAGPPHPPAPPAEIEPIDQATDGDENVGRRVKLKLDKKLMRILLPELIVGENLVGRVRVIALRKLEEKVELAPADGLVATDDDLQILFPEYPRARILVRTDKIGQGIFLVVEPQMALWADKPMPYTLKKIKSEAFKTRRAADEFFASLAAAEAEFHRLENWLNTARNIPLDDFNEGKFRLKELDVLVKQMKGRVEKVNQGVQQINALEQLARLLHDRAILQFAVADSQ
ncbi:MAG: hypothetical protein IH831_11595 [Planctomycetes bacterium]|nr:hypothetical protein [Planctomycetota bacterium]